MCGTVGLFIGCNALDFCPKKLLASPPAEIGGDGESRAGGEQRRPGRPGQASAGAGGYRSPFNNWHERASVRRSPRRTLSDEHDTFYFSPDLVPVAGHPLVKELAPENFAALLTQHMYRYLDFTAKLEDLVVNRTLMGIAHGSVAVSLPDEMRFDAFKMHCDEAYHSLFCVDLIRQVRDRTGVAPRLPRQPFALRQLNQIIAELPAEERALGELLFVIVSETLISASLAEVPDAPDVDPAVRAVIRDHAADEGRHHSYFASFLRHLWGQLDHDQRLFAGGLTPRLIDAFLRPDVEGVKGDLLHNGLDRDDAEQVVAEVYRPEIVAAHSAATSQLTRRYFEDVGAFSGPEALAELDRFGLV